MNISNKISIKDYQIQLHKQANLSGLFLAAVKSIGTPMLSGMIPEFGFHPKRKWRFDFAWPAKLVAVECDGIAWQAGGGRHNTDADREKMNTAVSMGWRVLRFSGKQIRNDPSGCIEFLKRTLN